MIRGTIQLNSQKEKVFLPELTCDFFIGILQPNQMTIDKDGYKITEETNGKENDIAYAKLNYYEKTCAIETLE